MTKRPDPPNALIYFPLAGDLEQGLAAVRVIDWGQLGSYTRLTQAGPRAHELHKDDEIEGTIRSERLCGGCRSGGATGQLMVELVVADGAQICGASYTLALALADRIARGCLPRLAGRMVIASGVVKRDGAIAAVGRMDEKLAALACELTRRPLAAPLLVLAQDTLDALTTDERQRLQGLIAAGVQCEGVAALAHMGSDWPPETAPGPDSWWRRLLTSWRRLARQPVPAVTTARGRSWRVRAAVLVIALIGGLLVRPPIGCDRLSTDPATIERCWAPRPVILRADCAVQHQSGERTPRHCPSGTFLSAEDGFSLEVRPAAAGWLYVYYLDEAGGVLEDLRPNRKPWPVLAGQTLPLILPGRISSSAGRPANGRFFAVLTREPLPALEGAPAADLKQFLDAVADEFVLCGDP
ncbi:hypothetical protein [uncultured Thiodictyon sp.]|uniref:hypothetical protein n=1 Tax=uncultured Thiodictyon sp. TaxID=1846217 RepID=UPI0025D9D660|nr:hypothetical protein [uncultured Thiodictyon sp.]